MHFFESNLLKMINYSKHAGDTTPAPPHLIQGTRTLFLINHKPPTARPLHQTKRLEAINSNTFNCNNYSRIGGRTNKMEIFLKKTIQM